MSTYQCDKCGHYIVQPLTDKPTYHTCKHDRGGTFQLIPPDLSLLMRLLDGVKGKKGFWEIERVQSIQTGGYYIEMYSSKPYWENKLFSDSDLATVLTEAYKYCKDH